MKRILLFLLPLFASCSVNNDEIERVALGYLDAMGNYRFDDAKPFATDETIETTLRFCNEVVMAQADTNAVLAANIKANMPATIVIDSIVRQNDTAALAYFTKNTPTTRNQHGKKLVVLRHGHWRVHEVIVLPDLLRTAIDTVAPHPNVVADSLRAVKLPSSRG